METFLYGCLGAALPQAFTALKARREIAEGLPAAKTTAAILAITAIWIAGAGFFATALPGTVAPLTALYAGLSLPITIKRLAKKSMPKISVDTITLKRAPSLSEIFLKFLLED